MFSDFISSRTSLKTSVLKEKFSDNSVLSTGRLFTSPISNWYDEQKVNKSLLILKKKNKNAFNSP